MYLADIYRNFRLLRFVYSYLYYFKWLIFGKPVDVVPHVVKRRTISYLQKKFRLNTLIETGTYLGDMVYAQRKNFREIHSIELSEQLFQKFKRKFAKYKHIRIYQGDSASQIKEVLKKVQSPALFWLDAHYSAGITAKSNQNSVALIEIASIFQTGLRHVILLDDARCFNGYDGYPSLNEINFMIKNHNISYTMKIENDIVILLPD